MNEDLKKEEQEIEPQKEVKKKKKIDFKKIFTKENIYDFLYVNFGILIVAIALSFFIEPHNLVMGGSTGLSILLQNVTGIDYTFWTFVINAVLLIIGLIFIGKEFFIKTVYGSLMLPVFMLLTNWLYELFSQHQTAHLFDNMALVIIVSSILMGMGIGMVMKKGGSTGGTEVPQQMFLKYCHIPLSVSLFIIDGVIVTLGAFFVKEEGQVLSFNFNMLLYAVVFIYLSGFVMDQIVFSGFNSRAVTIISNKNDIIKERILKDFNRGATEISAKGGYTGHEKTQLICVLSSNEFYKLKAIIQEIDPYAFFYVVRANEVSGEGFTRRP